MMTTTPPQNQIFYIASRMQLNPPDQPSVLGIAGNNPAPCTRVILWPQEITGAQSQLWSMTSDGHILSQLNGYALTWDADENELVTAIAGDPSYPLQLWSVTNDGYIKNQLMNSDLLTVIREGGGLILCPPENNVSWYSQLWILLAPPSPPPSNTTIPKWVYIQSALQDTDGNNCALNVEYGSTAPGTRVIVWPVTNGVGRNSLWQIMPDGRILSAQGNNLVLMLGSADDGDGNYVAVGAQYDPLPLTQVWDLSTPSQIRSAFSGEFLVPQGGTEAPITLADGDPVLAAPGTPNQSYTWCTMPPSPLEAIMAQPPVPFPEFTGDEADACNCILSRLNITSLRAEYPDLNQDLSGFDSQITSWSQAPNDIPQQAWDQVRCQFTNEIQYAITTRNLFINYNSFHLALFQDRGALLNELISAAGITEGTNEPNVGGGMLAFFEGLLYTVLSSAEPGVYPVLGNLMETGINAALAVGSGSGSISPDPFQVAVSDLWGELDNNFNALLSAMGTMETAILQDWGKLRSVYPLTQPEQALCWDPNTTECLLRAACPGYVISTMQILLPAKYQIYSSQSANCPYDIPAYVTWQSEGLTYWIADIGNPEEYPTEDAMQKYIWGNGVRQEDFFLSCAGWGFPIANDNSYADSGSGRFTFTNLTPNMLQLANLQAGDWTSIGPYQSIWVDLFPPDPGYPSTTCEFQVMDANNRLCQNQVAQFTVQLQGHTVRRTMSVTVSNTSPGYKLTHALCSTAPGWYTAACYASAAAQISLTQA